jgi:hypothetical protein
MGLRLFELTDPLREVCDVDCVRHVRDQLREVGRFAGRQPLPGSAFARRSMIASEA